jgi:hypothetical protein
MWKRVGDVLVELCEERTVRTNGEWEYTLLGYSLEVNNTLIMFFPAKDHAIAQEAYERLIYALS